jgi:hypothetical protein
MRLYTLPVLLSLIAIQTTAQRAFDGQEIIKKKCTTHHLSFRTDKYQQGYPGLFNNIQLLDRRKDTTRLGILRISQRGQDEFRLPSSDPGNLAGYINTAYAQPGAPRSLLIVLKDLWISCPEDYVPMNHFEMNITFHAEAYLRTEAGYQPVTFIDSIAEQLDGQVMAGVAENGIRDLFAAFMNRIASYDLTRTRRTVTLSQIDSFSQTRFNYPADTATPFAIGVYKNLEEFRNDAPSILKYEISKDGLGDHDLNIPDETGKFYLTHTVWGYSDGKQLFYMFDGNLYPVFRIGHQFYVFGSKEYHYRKLWLAPFGLPIEAIEELIKTMRVFRLDVDTGNLIE